MSWSSHIRIWIANKPCLNGLLSTGKVFQHHRQSNVPWFCPSLPKGHGNRCQSSSRTRILGWQDRFSYDNHGLLAWAYIEFQNSGTFACDKNHQHLCWVGYYSWRVVQRCAPLKSHQGEGKANWTNLVPGLEAGPATPGGRSALSLICDEKASAGSSSIKLWSSRACFKDPGPYCPEPCPVI